MRKIYLCCFIFCACLSFSIGAYAKEPEFLGFAALIRDTSNPYWKTVEDGLRDAAQAHSITIKIHSLKNTMDAEEQLNQCETLLLKRPDVIIFAAVNNASLSSCLKKAEKSGTILIDIDGNINEETAHKLGLNVRFSVASNNYELGKKAAFYLTDQKNIPSNSALVIEGPSISEPGNLRVKGFIENLPKNYKIVSRQPADWDRLKAADLVNRVLLQHPETSVIFAANDTMALGAAEAVSLLKKKVIVIGVDGTADAVSAIKSGKLTASVAQFPYLMAEKSVELGLKSFGGEKISPYHQNVPVLVIDQNELTHNTNPLLYYMR